MSSAAEIAVQGLRTTNKQLGIAALNINNADNPKYSVQNAQVVSKIIAGKNAGPEIAMIERFYDENLNRAIRDQLSSMSMNETVLSYMTSIKSIVGASSIDDPRSPEHLVSNFFASMHRLSGSVLDLSLKTDAISNGHNLAVNLSDMSGKLFQERYKIDLEIGNSIDKVNEIIENLREINVALNYSQNNKGDDINYYQKRDSLLQELSKYIDVRASIDLKSGVASVSTNSGKTLLAGKTYAVISYNPTTSSGDFINHLSLDPMKISLYDYDGDFLREDTLVTAGIDGEDIKSNLQAGKIAGLIELRDNTIPKMTKILDNLSKEVAFQVNRIHNTGSGYPPINKMLGSKPSTLGDYTEWQGSTRIAILDESGKAIKRQDGTEFKPLNLDLSKLSSGNGTGRPDMQTIIDEINEYFHFAPGVSKVSINDAMSTKQIFRDVKMVAVDDIVSTPMSNVIRFKMEVDSSSGSDATFEVLNVGVTDGANAPVPGAATISNGYSLIKAGDRTQTNQEIAIDVGAAPNPPYKLDVTYRALGADGTYSTGVITYIINPPNQQVRNQRFVASAATINSSLTPPDGDVYATASLVDTNGNDISSGDITTQGFLSIKTNLDKYRIVIDDDSSRDIGLPSMYGLAETPATKKGFSHYFGLNDFFTQNFDDENYALKMQVRPDILSKPELLATGKMVMSNDLQTMEVTKGDNKASLTLTFFDNTNFSNGDTITVAGKTLTFVNVLTGAANEVQIGALIDDSLNNFIIAVQDLYYPDMILSENTSNGGAYSLKFTATQAGMGSNNIPVSANFAIVQGDVGAGMAIVPTGFLAGGTDTTELRKIERYGYNIGRDSNQVIFNLSNIAKQNFVIGSAGGLTGGTMTLSGYATNFVSYSIRESTHTKTLFENSKVLYKAYQEEYESKASVDVEAEQMKLSQILYLHQAITKIIQVSNKMNDALLEIL
jgi:flagellar hook-associated protein 1 FlgK